MNLFGSKKNTTNTIDPLATDNANFKYPDLIDKLKEDATYDPICKGNKAKCENHEFLKKIYNRDPTYYNQFLNKHGGKSRRNRSKRKRNTKNKRRKSKRTRKSRR